MNWARTTILLAAMTALFMAVGYMLGGRMGMVIAFVVAAGMNAYAFWNSDKAVLRQQGARLVSKQTEPELIAMVEQLARNANMPMPAVYIIDQDQPNAFATGRSPDNAAVAATTGLMRRMTHDELAGVMAHELAHIQNRDTLTMTITATLAGAIGMLANFAFLFQGRGDNRSNPLGLIGTLAIMFLAPMAAAVVQFAISRTREYSADKLGAEISGDPHGLANALRKIESFAHDIENPRAEHHPESAHMFIINPLSGAGRDKLFSTHPSTANRIAELEKLAQSQQFAGSGARQQQFFETPSKPMQSSAIPRSPRQPKPSRRSGPWN